MLRRRGRLRSRRRPEGDGMSTHRRQQHHYSPALLLAGLVLIGITLRPALTAVAPLLRSLSENLQLSASTQGLLTTLPVLCLALGAPLAPKLAHRFGYRRLLGGALAIMAIGALLRVTGTVSTLFLGTVLAALAIGVCNVAVFAMVKRHFPGKVTLITSVVSTFMTLGATASAGLMVPLQRVHGGHWNLAIGYAAVPTVIALLFWIPQLLRREPHAANLPPARSLHHSRLAWQMTAFMGLQSMLAYIVFSWLPALAHSRGLDDQSAGFLLSLSSLIQAAGSIGLPLLARRLPDQRGAVVTVVALTATGLGGLVWAPVGGIWLWAVVLGLGQGAAFALALSLIGLRSPDPHTAGRMSSMQQGFGYLLAGTGPLTVGLVLSGPLQDPWTVIVLGMFGVLVLELLAGLAAGRDRLLPGAPAEHDTDQLPEPAMHR
ncbi:MFS transporter [Pseudonocardiaceae bacterium YIM PH 21723]|nr:MFS transporter [Pseudonocardiaceae bacterium YIM PH 21723]